MPSINDIFNGTVRDIATDGSGVVEHGSGQVFFVPGVWLGEEAEFCVTGFKKRFGFARLQRLISPSPQRIEPPCPHHGFSPQHCGGCPWQFVEYSAQLAMKEARVRRSVARLGFEEVVQPIWASPDVFGYRNRAQLKTDGRKLGYVAQGSGKLAAIRDCLVLTDNNRQTLAQLQGQLPSQAWKPARKSQWTTLDIDEDVTADTLIPNQRRPFQQGNSRQNHRMRGWLAEQLAELDNALPVLELFAGSGNFTQVLAGHGFDRIFAVDGVGEAIDTLRDKRLPGVQALAANLYRDDAYPRLKGDTGDINVLVADPPRDGIKNLAQLLGCQSGLQEVFYISCDLATFSRDLAVLVEAGFEPFQIQPLDQFPHTPHIELLAGLRKIDS